MNREALFCDGTGDYVCPAEPEINEKVVLRFRTAHNDVNLTFTRLSISLVRIS